MNTYLTTGAFTMPKYITSIPVTPRPARSVRLQADVCRCLYCSASDEAEREAAQVSYPPSVLDGRFSDDSSLGHGPIDRGCSWDIRQVVFEAEDEASFIALDEMRGNHDICRWDPAKGQFEASHEDEEDEKLSAFEKALAESALDDDDEVETTNVYGQGQVLDRRSVRRALYGYTGLGTSISQGGENERTQADVSPEEDRDSVMPLDAEDHAERGRGGPTAQVARDLAADVQERLLAEAFAFTLIACDDPENRWALAPRLGHMLAMSEQLADRQYHEATVSLIKPRRLHCAPAKLKARLAELRSPSLPKAPRSKMRVTPGWLTALDAAIGDREALDRKPIRHRGMPSLRPDWIEAGGVPSKRMIVLEHAAGPVLTEEARKPKWGRNVSKVAKNHGGYLGLASRRQAQGFHFVSQDEAVKAQLRAAWKVERDRLNQLMTATPSRRLWWEWLNEHAVERAVVRDGRRYDTMRLYVLKKDAQWRQVCSRVEQQLIWFTVRNIQVSDPMLDTIVTEVIESPQPARIPARVAA